MEAFREAELVAAAGQDVVHLSLGQPGQTAPRPVLDYLSTLINTAPLGYTDARGMMQLRERIAQFYHERYGLEIPVSRIFVTVGSSAAFVMTMLAAFDEGASIAIGRPCYPAYPNIMKACSLNPMFLDTDAAQNFQPSWEMLAPVKGGVKGMVIASPSNPAGTMMPEGDLETLATQCEAEGIRLISDEIYHGVTYGKEATSVLKYSDSAFVMNSFSKYFLLPGWRLGWAVVPQSLTRAFESLLQNFFISPPAISQYAALKVFDHLDALDKVVESYDANRDVLIKGLQEAGLTKLSTADGAFYIYADISDFSRDSKDFCRRMLHEAGVCAVPGNDFDESRGHDYVRFSFSGELADIERAVERLHHWLKQ